MESKRQESIPFFKNLYDTLVSMKFAVIILIVLGAVSLLSMLINEYPNIFAEDSVFYKVFQQHSPYSSWWYSILLWFLIISVFLCVVQNTGPILRSIFKDNFKTTDLLNNSSELTQFKSDNKIDIEKIKKALKKQFFKIVEKEDNGEILIVASKFKWGALGHLLTHISLLVIVIGSIIYSNTQRQEFRYIIAQEFSDTEYHENFPDLFSWDFAVSSNEQYKMLVDSFRVRYYDEGHGPSISDFRSYVRIFDQAGNLLKQHELTVNAPLLLKHVSIHQSDYKPLVDAFFRNVPNRRQAIAQAQRTQELMQDETNWITGLSLRANKGKNIIFAGMFISAVGLALAFMFWPRHIWITQKDDTITILGKSVKNKIAFKNELDNIIDRIKNE